MKELTSGSLWILIGSSFSKFITLLAGIIAANILGKIGYGELGIVRSSVNMFVVVATAGLGITSTKFIAQYLNVDKERVEKSIKVILIFSATIALLVSCGLLVLARFVSVTILNAQHLTEVIKVGGVMLFFSALNAVQSGILYGFRDYKSIAINSVLASLVEIICLIIGAYYFGVKGAIVGSSVSFLVYYIANNVSIRRHYRDQNISLKVAINISDFSIIWSFAIPAALSTFLVVPTLWFIKSLLVRDSGFGELAVFDIAEQWRLLILFIPLSLGRIILPSLSKYEGTGELEKQIRIIKVMVLVNLSITIVTSLIVYFLSGYILGFYGEEYNDIAPLVFMSLSTVFGSVANVVGQVIASKSKMWVGFSFNLFWACATIFLSFYFLKAGYKASALAVSLLISYFIHAFFQLLYVFRLLKDKNSSFS